MSKRFAIQPFRYQIDVTPLAGEPYHVLTFPWQQILYDLEADMKRLRGDNDRTFKYWPWDSLNALLNMSATWVHPFRKPFSQRAWQALTLGNLDRPTLQQLAYVTATWVQWWIEGRYEKQLNTPTGQALLQQAIQKIVTTTDSDRIKETQDQARQAWETAMTGALVTKNMEPQSWSYQVLPSILARRLAGQTFDVPGYGQATWWLTQEGDHWSLVSDLIPDTKSHHFAYLIEFKLHTVPYDLRPVVDLYIHCRRYVEDPLRGESLGKRIATVMLATDTRSSWLPGWPSRPEMVMIPLRLAWDYRRSRPYWDDSLPHLLKRYEQTRELLDLETLVSDPKNGWRGIYNHRPPEDGYFTIYREGMDPNHGHETGFGSREQYLIWEQVTAALADVLTPLPVLERDPQSVGWARPLALRYPTELAASKQFIQAPTWTMGKRTQRRLDNDAQRTEMLHAWERSLETSIDNHRPSLLLLYQTELIRDEVLAQVEQFAPYVDLNVVDHKVPPHLIAPLVDKDQFSDDDLRHAIKVARITRATEWEEYLRGINSCQARLAIVETADPFGLHPEDLSPKGAVRAGGARAGLATQMLISRQQKSFRGKSVDEDMTNLHYRVAGALADILLRQPPILLGNFRDVYYALGLSPSVAEELTVIGLYHRRTYTLGITGKSIQYPLAVRIKPDSVTELLRPGTTWQSYLAGTQSLIQDALVFRDTADKRMQLNASDICAFVENLVAGLTGPNLLIVNSYDFRSYWKMLRNPSLRPGELTFGSVDSRPTDLVWDIPEDLPGLRVVRILQNNETPTAVRVDDLPKYRDAEGLYKLPSPGELYLSFGKSPSRQDPNRLKIERPKGFRRAQGLEIAPFFLQPGDDPAQWARLVHALRFTPNWERETLYPLPAHLARAALEDCMCLFRGDA